ncbi:MAG: EAL domain-containing protein [Pseudomonadota bacterium]|nr:EAL domain-containing protein [Pseudomonadota bacterium]
MIEETGSGVKRAAGQERINLRLPARISGIVFWGLVLIGLAVAVFLLHAWETQRKEQEEIGVALLTYAVKDALQEDPGVLRQAGSRKRLTGTINGLREIIGFEAVELSAPGLDPLLIGRKNPESVSYSRVAQVQEGNGRNSTQIQVEVYFEPKEVLLGRVRNNVMLITGLTVLIFGVLLQKLLERMIARPFSRMVGSAKRFASGGTSIRFDESSDDEFAFLGKFINQALDSIVRQRKALEKALSRVKASESELAREKELAEVTLHSITDAVITADSKGLVQYMNPVAERLTGWQGAEVLGRPLGDIFHLVDEHSGERVKDPVHQWLDGSLESMVTCSAALRRRHDPSEIVVEASAAPMHSDRKEVIGVVMVFQDVTQARKLTLQLSHQASRDELTGLFNRRHFEERLSDLISEAQSTRARHALCYLDLDQFKIVNDTCGHMAGDELLRQISLDLKGCIRDADVLARLGGDEFGVLLVNCPLEKARKVAELLRTRVKDLKFAWDDKSFQVGVSIGVVAIDRKSGNMADILSAADLACYEAKDAGRNRIHTYNAEDSALVERHGQMQCATEVAEALENSGFLMFRQPIVPVKDAARPIHWEILIRMAASDGVLTLPERFLSAAERYNLMHKIDRYVIREIFGAMSRGCCTGEENGEHSLVSINLSGGSICDDGLLEFIQRTSAELAVSLDSICFEVTETVAISNLSKAKELMRRLRDEGCHFALDDFGSGLSSFGYLKTLPVDYIKIDGGFVHNLRNDVVGRAMVEAINRICHVMNIQTVAEWVEDSETLGLLHEIGVDFAQGYFTGRPVMIEPIYASGHAVGNREAV